ncbi:MAG: polysaccharide deacetylase family protein [Candidatus Howiella sp.]
MKNRIIAFLLVFACLLPLSSCANDLPAPASLQAVAEAGCIALSWPAVDGAAGYAVNRECLDDGSRKQLTIAKEAGYRDTLVTDGQSYRYTVASCSERNGNYYESKNTAVSDAVTYTTDTRELIITGLQSVDGGYQIEWASKIQAASYDIYRSSEENGAYTFVGATMETAYTDLTAGGGCFFYQIRCTAAGAAFSSDPAQTLAAPAIDSVTMQDASTAVVHWSAVGATSYEIYRGDDLQTPCATVRGTCYADPNAGGNVFGYAVRGIYTDDKGTCVKTSPRSSPVSIGTNPHPVRSLIVLMYHNFVTPEEVTAGIQFDQYSIYVDEFEADLLFFKNNGYTTVGIEEIEAHCSGERLLPEKAVMISIDDGSWGVYKYAYPLLQKYGMKAEVNIIGEFIDDAEKHPDRSSVQKADYTYDVPYCTWNELKEMSDAGVIEAQSHTYYLHRYDANIRVGAKINEGESEADYARTVHSDFEAVQNLFSGKIGKTPTAMAYPYSKRDETSDRLILENTGYHILLAGDGRGSVNFIVSGVGISNPVLNRVCRMQGTGAERYITDIVQANGLD